MAKFIKQDMSIVTPRSGELRLPLIAHLAANAHFVPATLPASVKGRVGLKVVFKGRPLPTELAARVVATATYVQTHREAGVVSILPEERDTRPRWQRRAHLGPNAAQVARLRMEARAVMQQERFDRMHAQAEAARSGHTTHL